VNRIFTESVVEQAALAWLESAGWTVKNGVEIAPGEPAAERDDYGQVVLERRLRAALARLNPNLPAEAREDAFRKLMRPEGAELVARNRAVHRLLVDGVTVEYRAADGEIRDAQARVVDFDRVDSNDWLAVNQFTVTEHRRSRRTDIVLFLNGLPLVVLVRDMWLTGFDAPSLHTMYIDKPMHGHGLMQAIARVNRVFKDKPGGLVVDYLGLAQELKAALATYTESGGTGRTALDQGEAVAVMLEKHEVCSGLFHGFDRSKWMTGTPQERLGLLPPAQEHILKQENGKDRCLRAVHELSQAFALAVPHDEAMRVRDDLAFFQAVQAVLAKRAPGDARPEEDLDHAVRQIISRAVAPEGVMDIFAAAGLAKPDISILSDDFLAEVRGMPQKNLAVELLQKLLKGELNARRRKNVVQARSFAEMLEQTIRRYQNRAIEAAQVIEELIRLAKEMREANARGEKLGLTEDELAFYDALETNDSAVKVLGDEPSARSRASWWRRCGTT
jgi:type I site-specific restriction-modification system R (restriction) subunit